MRQILNIKDDEVIVYEITDQYLLECRELKISPENKKLYLDYLKKCDFESILLDQTQCVFSKNWITHFDTIKTDGDRIWSGDLEHYFEKYNFIWPEDHLCKIVDSNYQISKNSQLIIDKRRALKIELRMPSLSIDRNPNKDIIVQHRKVKRIKLTTTNAKIS